MREASTVTIIKSGNRMALEPTTRPLRELIEPALTFMAKECLYGRDRIEQNASLRFTPCQCFGDDHKHRLTTSFGFYDRVTGLLRQKGYKPTLKNLSPHKNPKVFEPLWDRLFDPKWHLELRYGQDEFLLKFMSRLNRGLPARFDCVTGYGKTVLVGFIGILLPYAKIHVASKRVPVLRDRIYPELCGMLPDVGICCGSKKVNRLARVMCYTFDSLGHSDGDADILIVDECHEAAADNAAYQLARYDRSINFGFSATHDMRLDNKDLRVEAMFGPVVYKIPYQDAVEHGLVAPIEVHWTDVVMDLDPVSSVENSVERKRLGVWRNSVRNELIARNARADQKAGLQQLITCETTEHVLALKKLLPDFEIIYAENSINVHDKMYFRNQGLWPAGHEVMTVERRKQLTTLFERGKLLNVICTTVWNVGVNFRYLRVVNRADAGGSPINDTQIPGRNSRFSPDGSKQVGKVRDYRDQFNRGFRQRATKRKKNYEAHGWKQIFPGNQEAKPNHLRLWHDEE